MSLGLNWEKAWLRLRLLAREGSGPGFRKPLSWPWQVGLGVAAVVTFVLVYSLLSWYRQSEKDTVYTLTAKSLTFLRGREVPPLVWPACARSWARALRRNRNTSKA